MPIIEFKAEIATNPYTQEVADLIASGPDHATELFVPTATKNAERRKFSKAANAAEKTARLRIEEVVKKEDGTDSDKTRLVFTLKPKDAPRRGKDGETATEEAPADAPAEAEVETPAEAPVEASDNADAPSHPRPRKR